MDPAGVKRNPRIRGVYVYKSQRNLQWNLPLKSGAIHLDETGVKGNPRVRGVYVLKSQMELQWSLPLKSPGDINLDLAGVKGNPRVMVYMYLRVKGNCSGACL